MNGRLFLLGWLLTAAGAAGAAHGVAAVGASAAPAGSVEAIAEDAKPAFGLDKAVALGRSQAVLGHRPADYTLRDGDGQMVELSRYRGRPLLVNFIYTGCFHVCPNSTRALHQAVAAMRDRFGSAQFNVVTIGFNQPSDSPTAMRDFARQQRIDDPNWAFLSPRRDDVAALSEDFGFSFVATPMGFDHLLQVSIVDAEGRIHEQVYGDAFSARSLGEPLRRLLAGSLLSAPVLARSSLSDLFERVRILCSVYDPATGKYRVDYSLYIEIAGFLTFVLTLLVLLTNEWRARRARRRGWTPL
ncbi:MAG: SCO family protein [Lysobacterales bacterium]